MSDTDPTRWPVYNLQYRVGPGQYKTLRVEWLHRPRFGEVEQVVGVLKAYADNPADRSEVYGGFTFKTLKPDYCVIMAGAHSTLSSQTDRPPDGKYHISARFSTQAHRIAKQGWSVHIYVDPFTKKYLQNEVTWDNPTKDKFVQRAVYENRTAWPPGVGPDTAPWAPGEAPSPPPPTTASFTDASIPAQNAWSMPLMSTAAYQTFNTQQQTRSNQNPYLQPRPPPGPKQ